MNTETIIKTEYFIEYCFDEHELVNWITDDETNDGESFVCYADALLGLKEAMINCDDGITWRIIKVHSKIDTTIFPQEGNSK